MKESIGVRLRRVVEPALSYNIVERDIGSPSPFSFDIGRMHERKDSLSLGVRAVKAFESKELLASAL